MPHAHDTRTRLKASSKSIPSQLVLAALIWLPALEDARAQVQPATDNTNQASAMQEIVVTAERREENLSRVPISITALTQDMLDVRGVKDFQDVAKFTPGVQIDNSGTNNISIRGIASTGGAGTTGIYLDDTPIQIRALALNPDDALPKSFDMERVEVLRGPQGTLFGSGSEGGTVRYITVQPSVNKTSFYSRSEISTTQGGDPSYEVGAAAGGPLVEGKFGARATVWYREDGGWIDRINPTTLAREEKNTNHGGTMLVRLAGLWAASDNWSVTPSIYYQNQQLHDTSQYWPIYSNPGDNRFVSANPTPRGTPDKFYLPAVKIQGDFRDFRVISNTSYYHRQEQDAYDGTLYNLSFYQVGVIGQSNFLPNVFPLLDGATGVHLPAGALDYRSPASIDNSQETITQEIRLQSLKPNAQFVWTTGVFFSSSRQTYLEQIHDPLLDELFIAATGQSYTAFFVDPNGNPVLKTAPYPDDSYFLHTNSKDQQQALFGEATYGITEQIKVTAGARYSRTQFSFDTLTGGPQTYSPPRTGSGNNKEHAFTPKLSLSYQMNPDNLFYTTYSKGFRPGGANNPLPAAACGTDFTNFGITASPTTYSSDSVGSFEVGSKNNFNNRVKLASSIYYIKWNNIQQTVVPPICQISFIDNLGQAVAKGADIQLDVAVTDHFTAEITTGYTDARYTQDVKLSGTETTPIVAKGDAIVGQSSNNVGGTPGSPFTASAGLEYRFELLAHESFLRADYQYDSRAKWVGANQDPNTQQFQAANFPLQASSFFNLRGGMDLRPLTVSMFVDNLTNTHVLTNYNFQINPGVVGVSQLQRNFTFRPRTIGLTAIYKY